MRQINTLLAGAIGTLLTQPGFAAEQTLSKIRVEAESEADPFKANDQESATKSTLSIRETPQAISVVTSESMDERQVRDVTSALELVAGLVPSSESTLGGPFAGRGLEQSEGFSLRGQTLNNARDIRVDGFVMAASQFDVALFDRIEVLKGPSSTLYGQGSLGGFINFVRKKPTAERNLDVSLQAGSWNTYRAEADITGALDDAADWQGRLITAYDDGDSFIDGVWTRKGVVAPSMRWQPREGTTVLMEALYQKDTFVPSHGVPLFVENNRLRMPSIPRSRFIGAPSANDSSSRNEAVDLRVDQTLSDTWLATLLLEKGRNKFARYFDNYGHGGLSEAGDTKLYADTYRQKDDLWSGELRVDGFFEAFGRKHQVLLGVERRENEFSGAFAYSYVGVGNIYSGEFPTDGTLARDLPVDTWTGENRNSGAYAQFLFSVADRTKILAGLRRDRAEQAAGVDEQTKEATTLRVGVTHDVADNITAYATYGESFNPVEQLAFDNTLLDPERGKAVEAGLKTEWFDRRLGVTLALYQLELDKRPIPDPDPAHQALNPDASISAGLQRNRGLEIELNGSPFPGFTIAAGAAWGTSKYVDRNDPSFGLVPYGFINRNAGAYAAYEWQDGALRGFGAGATYTYVGKRSFAYGGLVDLGFVNNATSDQLWFEGYDRTDLNFFYNGLTDWRFALQVRNVFDQTYIEHMRDIESNNYFGAPRAYLMTARYAFR
jgi:TonB-dependent siderophore receptor